MMSLQPAQTATLMEKEAEKQLIWNPSHVRRVSNFVKSTLVGL